MIMADSAEIDSGLVVLELLRAPFEFCEFALALAEDAQVFAGAIELSGAPLTPADAVRLFGRKLRETARRLAPQSHSPVFQTMSGD